MPATGTDERREAAGRQCIVHVLTKLSRGGAEENTIGTCMGQLERGHDVHLVFGADVQPDIRASLPAALDAICLSELVHPVSPVSDAKAILSLRRTLRRLDPDVVHTHQSKGGIVGRLAAAFLPDVLVVHTVHIAPFLNVGPVQRAVYLLLERVAARFTDRFISVSEGMADAYRSRGIGADAIHHVVHSGMALDKYVSATPPEDWAGRFDWNGEQRPFIILMLASFDRRKRHIELVRVLADMLDRHADTLLCFAGEGEFEQETRALVHELDLGASIRFLGHDPQPEKLLALADLCVLCSEREGLPRVLVQYVAARRRVVVMDLPGIDELMSNYQGATVIRDDDFERLAQAIEGVRKDEFLPDRVSTAQPAVDLGSWEMSAMVDGIEQVYREGIDSRGGG